MQKQKVKKAIIPAAGLGTRMLPITRYVPKEMFPIGNKPAIEYIIDEAIKAGIEEIGIIVNRSKTVLIDYLEDVKEYLNKTSNINIELIYQVIPGGLGHAILCTERFIDDEPFAVLLGDNLVESEANILKQMIDLHDKTSSYILFTQLIPDRLRSSFGIVEMDDNFKIINLIEKPEINKTTSNLAIMGRYILLPSIFNELKTISPSYNEEIQLTDALQKIVNKNEENILASYLEDTSIVYDIGTPEGYAKALKGGLQWVRK